MSEQIKNKLWNIVENSNVYSFEKKPLAIFKIFMICYLNLMVAKDKPKNADDYVKLLHAQLQNNKQWKDFLFELLKESENDLDEDTIKFLDVFEDTLCDEIGDNVLLLKDIVDFFTEKYISLHSNKYVTPSLSEDLIDFIYWYVAEYDDRWVDELALYIPYAGMSPFGKKHIEEIKSQIEMYSIDSCSNHEEYDEHVDNYRKAPWYYGVESDKTLRLISNVCLLVRTPDNFEQMFVHSGEALDDISDFTGGWTFLAVPPLESYTQASEYDVKLISALVDKFIDAKGMYNGIFILPKIVCYDKSYEWIRRKMVCSGNLSTVIELPQSVFNTPCNAVLICLCKSTYECGTKMLNGADFMNDVEWDYHELRDSCIHGLHPNKGKIIGDYTLSQCNYCILPSMYLHSETILIDNEDLKSCYDNYKTFIESQSESEKKRIAHRDISGHLSHMLGTTYHKIFDAISELKYVEGLESTYSMLNDNFEYMRRLINSVDDDFSSQSMKLEIRSINEFMQKYCCAWKNYGKKQFAVSLESKLNDDTTFKIDEIFMKVMLDAILENANRHGFDGVDVQNPQIRILTSYVMVNEMPCVLISIANNGASFPNDFSIEQYIREGEFGGTKGHTGRGGYHVYQIAKRHQGYISISSDDEWSVKINIMIPLEYYDECETEKFVKYGEECM